MLKRERECPALSILYLTMQLLLDIIGAKYWNDTSLLSIAPAHAIDLLICITVTTPSISKLVEALHGEVVVRSVMERITLGGEEKEKEHGSKRRAVTLNQVQDNPLAIKCAEFLLFFEYGREESGKRESKVIAVNEENTSYLSDSFRSAFDQTFQNHRPRQADKEKRKRTPPPTILRLRSQSSSPRKATTGSREAVKARREERIKLMRTNPIQTLVGIDIDILHTPKITSPFKSAPVSLEKGKSEKSSLTPFANAMSTNKTSIRGRSQDRSPLSILHQPPITPTLNPGLGSNSSSTNSSPLKSIIGPSPAVQRAQARSLSPVKRRPRE